MEDINTNSSELARNFAENYMDKLFYFCIKKTGSADEAEELTQDIALNVLSGLARGDVPANFQAWVWRIARNRYARWADARRKAREAAADADNADEIPDGGGSVPDTLVREEELSLLRRELAFICDEYRNIVVAYYIGDKSVREIAASLSLSEGAVKERLHRARNILKEGMNMAREFGKRSYNPERINYSNICERPGEMGQPWTLMEPKLNQNIFLACYDNPSTARELSIELGVALPYMEDTLELLTRETLLSKSGGKYKTDFPIISRDAREKLHGFYAGILPRMVAMLEENTDRLMEQYAEAGVSFYGGWVSYDEAKWVLLMEFYKQFYDLCGNSPKETLGQTARKNQGIWDVIAFEMFEDAPEGVGYHSQTNGFVHYRFGYGGIDSRTPDNLSEAATGVLRRIVTGESVGESDIVSELGKYDYIRMRDGRYIPHIVVFDEREIKKFLAFCDKKNFSESFIGHANARGKLIPGIFESLSAMNDTVGDILRRDLPRSIRQDKHLTGALTREVCRSSCTLGYVIAQAVADGWLRYDADTSRAIGAFMRV